MATPPFLTLVSVEFTDLVFAVDPIPAIVAVTRDPFIVYTSLVFAILGLRSLSFVLRGAVDRCDYRKLSLAALLTFVGVKMVLTDLDKVPIVLALATIAANLASGIVASLLHTRQVAGRVRADLTSVIVRPVAGGPGITKLAGRMRGPATPASGPIGKVRV